MNSQTTAQRKRATPEPSGDDKVGRRTKIIAATLRVLSREGIRGATMRAIAREMGLTTGVISHYFKDKDELMHEALQTCFDPTIVALEQAAAADDRWQAFSTLFLTQVPLYVASRSRGRMWIGLLIQIEDEPNLWSTYKSRYAWCRKQVEQLIKACQKGGHIRADIDTTVETARLLALIDGLMMETIGEPTRLTKRFVTKILSAHIEALRPALAEGRARR
jgi:AcrR family transcriptional regulator